MSQSHQIELISRTIAILEVLRDRPEGMSLQELTAQTGQVKSSIHRILRSLLHHGYIEQNHEGGDYRLGIQCLVLANGLRRGLSLVELARPHSRTLMEAFDETTYIAVLRAGRGIFVDVQETRRDLRLVGPLGAHVHFHATAAGKAMAAFFPPERQQTLLQAWHEAPITAHTLTTRAQIEQEWARVRQLGYAVNDEETIVGAVFLASPMFDAGGAVCGSVSIGLPKPRYSAGLGERIAAELTACCRRISEAAKAVGYVHENGFHDEGTRNADRGIRWQDLAARGPGRRKAVRNR